MKIATKLLVVRTMLGTKVLNSHVEIAKDVTFIHIWATISFIWLLVKNSFKFIFECVSG